MEDMSRGGSLGIEPGRRYLTLLFADLSRSTELAEVMEAEHYAAVLAALRQIYQRIIPRHCGIVVRAQGDGLLAMFGYPVTRESDGRDAVGAALELHQAVRQLRVELPAGRSLCLHSGIHAGLVLLHRGDVELGRYELLGSVPNVASRLSDQAGPDEVLVSEETLGPVSRYFVTGPPRLLTVRGRLASLLVYRVDARASLAELLGATTRSRSAAFVGRRAELEQLEQALEEAFAGRMRSVAVAGAPGMGKTRLVEYFLSGVEQRNCTVLRGYCDSELGAQPLQPFRHMLQSLADKAAPESLDEVGAVFTRLAERQPLVLFIDDWQWADDGSHQVLVLLRRCTNCRMLVILSTRPETVADAPVTADQILMLPPLGDVEAQAIIAARAPGADPFVAEEIRQLASGNPLFLEELCHSAMRRDANQGPGLVRGGAGWLNRLVESRVQGLAPDQIDLVRVAAVIGNVVPSWLLEQLTGQPTDALAQLRLVEQDFLFPGELPGTLRFKHGLARDIIYNSVGLHEREALHRRIAESMLQHRAGGTADNTSEALALHFDAGGDAVQAAHFAELAGDKALAASALDRARRLYRVALAALDRLPQSPEIAMRWVGVAHQLARVCVFDPVRAELALYTRAVAIAERHGDLATVARTRHWLGYISYGLGDVRTAIVHGERALAEASAVGDERLRVQVVAALGEAHCAAAQYDRGLALLDEAIAVKRRYRSGRHTNVGLAFSLVCRGYVLGDRGRFADAYEAFDEAASCIAGVRHEIGATLHGWRSAVLLWQGRWEEARDAAAESGRIAEVTRSLTQLSIARAMSAYADWMLAREQDSLQIISDVTEWLVPRESALFRSLNHGWLAAGMMESGRRKEGRHHAAQALQRSRQRDLLGAAMTYRALARDVAARCPQRAANYLALAMRAARERDSAHEIAATQLCAAEIAWSQADAASAAALLDEATQAFDAMAMPWHGAEARRLRRRIDIATRPAPTAA